MYVCVQVYKCVWHHVCASRCVCVRSAHVTHICGGEMTSFRNHFSPLLAPRNQIQLTGLAGHGLLHTKPSISLNIQGYYFILFFSGKRRTLQGSGMGGMNQYVRASIVLEGVTGLVPSTPVWWLATTRDFCSMKSYLQLP